MTEPADPPDFVEDVPPDFVPDYGPAKPMARSTTGADFSKGLEQGVSLGFSDELAGLSAALGSGLNAYESPREQWEAMKSAYREGRGEERQAVAEATERSPWATGAGRLTGAAVLSPFAPAGLVRGGAAMGAGFGLGSSEAETLPGMVGDTALGGATGAAFGLGAKGLLSGLGAVGQRMAQGSTGGLVPAARDIAGKTAEMSWFDAAKAGLPAMAMKAGAGPVASTLNAAERGSMAAGRQLAKLAPPPAQPPPEFMWQGLAPGGAGALDDLARSVPMPAPRPPALGTPGNPAVQTLSPSMPAGSLPRVPGGAVDVQAAMARAMAAQGGQRSLASPWGAHGGAPARPGGWDPRLGGEPPPFDPSQLPSAQQSLLGGPAARLPGYSEQESFRGLASSMLRPKAPVPPAIPAGSLSRIESEVIQAVATNPGASLSQLAARVGVPENQVRAALQPLMFKGYVAGSGGRYSVGPAAQRAALRSSLIGE